MTDGPEWFAPKRHGLGTGLPISWQGWVLTLGYVALVTALALGLSGRPPVAIAAAIILPTVVFIVTAARTTKGGWRWRWGGNEE